MTNQAAVFVCAIRPTLHENARKSLNGTVQHQILPSPQKIQSLHFSRGSAWTAQFMDPSDHEQVEHFLPKVLSRFHSFLLHQALWGMNCLWKP